MDSYLGIPGNHTGKIFDKLLELVPSGTSLAKDVGTGAILIGDGLVDADLVLDIPSSPAAAANITVQFCAEKGFASGVVSGVTIAIPTTALGRIIVPFRNATGDGTPLPYVRLMPDAAVTLGAFIAKK